MKFERDMVDNSHSHCTDIKHVNLMTLGLDSKASISYCETPTWIIFYFINFFLSYHGLLQVIEWIVRKVINKLNN